MAYLGSWKIDDLLTFTCNTHTAATGAATDADAVPAYRVYEDETGTAILTGNTAKLDDANTTGFYSEQITLSAANGFEKGKSYNVYISAAVASVTGTMQHNFQVEAEVDANTVSATNVSANVAQISGDGTAADNAEAFFDGTGYAGTNNTIPTVTTVGTVNAFAANSITAAAIADAAIDAATFAAGAITATVIATDAIAALEISSGATSEIATAVWAATCTDPAAVPAANASAIATLSWLLAQFRNKMTVNRTTGVVTLYADDGTTAVGTLTATDDGTTFTRPEAT